MHGMPKMGPHCPFRSEGNYLRPERWQGIKNAVLAGQPFHCHETVHSQRTEWLEDEDGSEEPKSAASEDGVATVVLSIRKQSGQNTVAVVDALRSRLAQVEKSLPTGSALRVVRRPRGRPLEFESHRSAD